MKTISLSRAILTRKIRKSILDLALGKKLKVVLLIDEAPCLRLDVFAKLLTLMEIGGSKPLLSMIWQGRIPS